MGGGKAFVFSRQGGDGPWHRLCFSSPRRLSAPAPKALPLQGQSFCSLAHFELVDRRHVACFGK
jgi:hypothetical protein